MSLEDDALLIEFYENLKTRFECIHCGPVRDLDFLKDLKMVMQVVYDRGVARGAGGRVGEAGRDEERVHGLGSRPMTTLTEILVCKSCAAERRLGARPGERGMIGAVVSQLRIECVCGGKMVLPHRDSDGAIIWPVRS